MESRPPRSCKTVAQAARHGRLEDLKKLIKTGHPVDVSDNRGWRPIHDAAAENHPECLAVLLENESTCIDWQAHDASTALLLAVKAGNDCCVKVLLDKKANVNLDDHMGITPLMAAVQRENMEYVSSLLCHGADTSCQQYRGLTALHISIELNLPEMVTKLLEADALIDVRSDFGITPLFLAAQLGHCDCLAIILHHMNSQGQNEAVNMCADDGASPVFLAAQEGHAECLRLLLEHGASVNLTVSEPVALPLHAALEFNHIDCLKMLLPITDREVLSSCASSPFHFSMLHSDDQGTRLLVESSFDFENCSLDYDYHPRVLRYFSGEVHFARKVGALTLLAINNSQLVHAHSLIAAGASLNAPNASHLPPLLPALDKFNIPFAQLLIERGVSVDLYHPKVLGNLAIIVSIDNWKCLNFVLRCGAEVRSLFQSVSQAPESRVMYLQNSDDDDDYETEPGVQSTPIPFWRMLAETRFLLTRSGITVAQVLYRILQFTSNVTLDPHIYSFIDENEDKMSLISLTGTPWSLLHLCRICIRRCLSPCQLLDDNIWHFLPLPDVLLDFLQYKDLP